MFTWNKEQSEYWNNALFDTREEAIKEAIYCGYLDFYIGETETIPLRTDASVDRILEELDQNYCNESGCDYNIYEGVLEKDIKWLEKKLSKTIKKFHKRANIKPNWYTVFSEEHIVLTKEEAKQLRAEKITLPCNTGDTIYLRAACECLCSDINVCPFEDECTESECNGTTERIFKTTIKSIYNDGSGFMITPEYLDIEIPINDIGKTVFLTEKEAIEHLSNKGGK